MTKYLLNFSIKLKSKEERAGKVFLDNKDEKTDACNLHYRSEHQSS